MRPGLQILHAPAQSPRPAPPLLLLHGAYTGAWVWRHFLDALSARGFDVYALSFSGHAGSAAACPLHQLGIADYVQDVVAAVATLPAAPIVVAHSMGGYVAQRYLAEGGQARALALLASVAPYGLGFSAWQMGVVSPQLLLTLQCFEFGGMTASQLPALQELLFAGDVRASELQDFARQAQQESVRALHDMLLPSLWANWRLPSLPALVLGAEQDRLIPSTDTLACAMALGVAAEFVPAVGHVMMLDQGWETVLARLAAWLEPLVD